MPQDFDLDIHFQANALPKYWTEHLTVFKNNINLTNSYSEICIFSYVLQKS